MTGAVRLTRAARALAVPVIAEEAETALPDPVADHIRLLDPVLLIGDIGRMRS